VLARHWAPPRQPSASCLKQRVLPTDPALSVRHGGKAEHGRQLLVLFRAHSIRQWSLSKLSQRTETRVHSKVLCICHGVLQR
jgi:hypothetical protein